MKTANPCTQKQRRFILALWHKIKLAEGDEPMWKCIERTIKKPKEDYWSEEKQRYELNWLSTSEAYKVCQSFMAIDRQNKSRGVNVVIKSHSEFAQKCNYCTTPIYWGVARIDDGKNERIPLEVIDEEMIWHQCPNKPQKK